MKIRISEDCTLEEKSGMISILKKGYEYGKILNKSQVLFKEKGGVWNLGTMSFTKDEKDKILSTLRERKIIKENVFHEIDKLIVGDQAMDLMRSQEY